MISRRLPPRAFPQSLGDKLQESRALRYALAFIAIAIAVLIHESPLGPFLHPTGLFLGAIVAAAWFGGAGPGLVAAALGAIVLPLRVVQLYPLLWNFFDVPRFLTFAMTAVAVGWAVTSWRRAAAALRRSEAELLKAQDALEHEVTARTAELRLSEARYARAMEGSDAGHWEWNTATDEMFVSATTREMLGLSAVPLPSTRTEIMALAAVPSEEKVTMDRVAETSIASGSFEYDHRLIVAAGDVRWLRWQAKVFRSDAGDPLMTGSITDVTENKRAQAERAKLEERLQQAEKMEVIGRFASGISHDFNNILGGILAYGEMLFDEAPESTPRKRYAQNVLTAATRGRDLVDQILAYTRSQRGRRAPTDVCSTVAETLELVRSSLPARITLHPKIPDSPLIVMGDATQLHQIVMNLCSNAIYAMKAGGPLRVAVTLIEVKAERVLSHGTLGPGTYARISIEDLGCGMDQATLGRIFEPFFTTKEFGRGTGLGLALVFAIVTDLEGAIDVKSVVDEGTTFAIYLPSAGSTGDGSRLEVSRTASTSTVSEPTNR